MPLFSSWVQCQGLWDVTRDGDGSNEGCILRIYVDVVFSKKIIFKGLRLPLRTFITCFMLHYFFSIIDLDFTVMFLIFWYPLTPKLERKTN